MDLELLENGNGGDLVKKPKDLSVINGFQNMAYLALFGGNPNHSTPVTRPDNKRMFDWWGNSLLFRDNQKVQFNSLTEQTLYDVAVTSSGVAKVEQSVKRDLAFMMEFANLEISVLVISDNEIEIKVLIDQPSNEQNKLFVYIWDSTKKELPSYDKNEPVISPLGNAFDGGFDLGFE